jgi:ribonuclease BN (tRNA processing enzyme)
LDVHPSSELLLPYKNLMNFIRGADILIAESQYLNQEYAYKIGWGHTALSNACLLAKLCNVGQWIITHHDPMHADDFLDEKLLLTKQILRDLDCHIQVCFAYDGLTLYV